MNCTKTTKPENKCHGCCAECTKSKNGKFIKVADVSVPIRVNAITMDINNESLLKKSI